MEDTVTYEQVLGLPAPEVDLSFDRCTEAFMNDEIDFDTYMQGVMPPEPEGGICHSCQQVVKVLTNMKDYIAKHSKQGDIEIPVTLFPHSKMNYLRMKKEVRLFKYKQNHCRCTNTPQFHPCTGKTSILVVALSFAYHTSNMTHIDTDHDDIIFHMESNYKNWVKHVKEMKPTACKTAQLKKIERYESVLAMNRQMYNPAQ